MSFCLRCLVGDPSSKSYGDVAFMEHHNLESNIECETTVVPDCGQISYQNLCI